MKLKRTPPAAVVITNPTVDDFTLHADESKTFCLYKIQELEAHTGVFNPRKTYAGGLVTFAAAAATALAVTTVAALTVPVLLLVTFGYGAGWVWLYAASLPSIFIATMLDIDVLQQRRAAKATWESRRRYAFGRGWLSNTGEVIHTDLPLPPKQSRLRSLSKRRELKAMSLDK